MTAVPVTSRAPDRVLEHPDDQPLLSRLAVTGSLFRELQALLAAAAGDAGTAEFRDLIVEQNVAGKPSAAQRRQVWWRLKLRYVLDPEIAEYRAFRAAMEEASPGERGLLCLLMFARNDRLFREITLVNVSPLLAAPNTLIDTNAVEAAIVGASREANLRWSPTTCNRAKGDLLSSLKDFGALQGRTTKRTVAVHLTPVVTVFAARLALLHGLTERQVLDSVWFRILGVDRDAAADALYTASRVGALTFRMQADVVELILPALEAA